MKLSVDVHNFLQNNEVAHEFFVMETPARNAKQAAAILGLRPKEVVKSIILFIDKEPVNAIVPSDKKVSFKKLKENFGDAEIEIASSRTTVETTGYVLGATPPVAHKVPCRTIIDEKCMDLDLIYTGGGELNAMLKIRPADLQRLTEAQVIDICQ